MVLNLSVLLWGAARKEERDLTNDQSLEKTAPMSGSPKRETHLTEIARVPPVVSLDPPHRHFRSARHASVSAGTELAPALDERRASTRTLAPLPQSSRSISAGNGGSLGRR